MERPRQSPQTSATFVHAPSLQGRRNAAGSGAVQPQTWHTPAAARHVAQKAVANAAASKHAEHQTAEARTQRRHGASSAAGASLLQDEHNHQAYQDLQARWYMMLVCAGVSPQKLQVEP